jgi:hypothetical protein
MSTYAHYTFLLKHILFYRLDEYLLYYKTFRWPLFSHINTDCRLFHIIIIYVAIVTNLVFILRVLYKYVRIVYNLTITFLDIIHHLAFYLKDDFRRLDSVTSSGGTYSFELKDRD